MVASKRQDAVTVAYVPQVVAEIVEVVRMIPVDVPLPQIWENRQCGEVHECNKGPSSNRDVPFPQIMDKRVQQRKVVQIVDFPGSQPCAEMCRVSVEISTLRAHQMAVPG